MVDLHSKPVNWLREQNAAADSQGMF